MITLYLPVCLRPQKKKGEKSCEGGGSVLAACSLHHAGRIFAHSSYYYLSLRFI